MEAVWTFNCKSIRVNVTAEIQIEQIGKVLTKFHNEDWSRFSGASEDALKLMFSIGSSKVKAGFGSVRLAALGNVVNSVMNTLKGYTIR